MKKIILIALSVLLMVSALIGYSSTALAAGMYTHPSGAFSVNEFGALQEEVENGALFSDGSSAVMVLFGEAQVEVTEETLPDVLDPILGGVEEFESYEFALDDIASLDNGYLIHFSHSPAGEFGSGDIFVAQADPVIYVMILLTPDYDTVQESWYETVQSFTVGAAPAEEVEAAVPEESGSSEPAPTDEAAVTLDDSAESGFAPEVNGFSFENYGNDIPAVNLTPAGVQRMFGDQVCANINEGQCTLTPPARQWMEQINNYMADGHCEGMAVLSALMYYHQIDAAQFGGSTAHDLSRDNPDLQGEIAYWWTTQGTYPGDSIRVNASPSAVLDTLIENFKEGPNASEWWVVGFYRRDGSAGHAVTPIGVEDMGNGIYHILIYDNNFPDQVRYIEVDRNANTWRYEGSPNPEIESFLYDGDASLGNLEIVALSPRLQQQQCDFCQGAAAQAANSAAPKRAALLAPAQQALSTIWLNVQDRWALLINGSAQESYEIWLDGDTHLLIQDVWGRRIGFVDGEFVNEIPGATTQKYKFDATTREPVYDIPVGLSFTVTVDAASLTEAGSSNVSMIGPGYDLAIDDIWLEPGEQESIQVHIDKSRHQLTYVTDYTESPDIIMGLETEEADYAFIVRATELTGAEDTFDVALDAATQEFILNTSYNEEPSKYQVLVLRIDEDGEHVFGSDEVVMEPDNTAYIPFTDWAGAGSSLQVNFDYENDGQIDDTFELPDVTGQIDFYAEEK